jgi:DNA uptake protein ComE-like DNA-binding protein
MRSRDGMTRSHARGVVALILIVLAAEAAIFIAGTLRISVSEAGSEPLSEERSNNFSGENQSAGRNQFAKKVIKPGREIKLFRFDPNTAGKEELMMLGLSQGEASVIISYRNKGGKFRKASDLEKIYTLKKESYLRIRDCVMIPSVKSLSHMIAETSEINPGITDNLRSSVDSSQNLAYEPVNTRELVAQNKLELNSADSAELVSLPGIGPFFASRILEYRKRLGGFVFCEQLMEVYGIDNERYSIFNSRIWADSTKITRLKLAEATAEQLSANPYIGPYAARSIIKFREQAGKGAMSVAILVTNRIIRAELAKILKYYLE